MTVLRAENLGKAFRRYHRPVDRLHEWFGGGVRHERVWAVRGVEAGLEAGQSLGIVGNNGAGKSTLLSMLAGAATPTEGHLQVAGHRGAILELGAGFHPEFTGRENVRMVSRAQGLSADRCAEIEAAVDAFAELGNFMDQPVRIYSTGMFLRLAFSLATAANPDLLIVDEALAVGDQRFQSKCLRRIETFRASGGSLVFCSHNLFQVKKLCAQVLWLDGGHVRMAGSAAEVCDAYADAMRETRTGDALGPVTGERLLRVGDVTLRDAAGQEASEFETGQELRLEILVRRAPGTDISPGVAIGLVRADGLVCHCFATSEEGARLQSLGGDTFRAELRIPELALLGGNYQLNVATIDNQSPLVMLDVQEGLAPFSVVNPGTDWGVSRIPHIWGSSR